jgi:hypothetical protein
VCLKLCENLAYEKRFFFTTVLNVLNNISLSQNCETMDEDIIQPEETFDTIDEYDDIYQIVPDHF